MRRASASISTQDFPFICTTGTCPGWPLTMSSPLSACDQPGPAIARSTTIINPALDNFCLIRITQFLSRIRIAHLRVWPSTPAVYKLDCIFRLRDQGDLSRQLEVDYKREPVIHLVKLRCSLRSQG